MIIFYLTIPFMVLATAIAIVPLVVAMRHEHTIAQASSAPVVVGTQPDSKPLAA
jgi:hypothetical protein